MKDLNITHLQRQKNLLRQNLKFNCYEQQLNHLRQVRNKLKYTYIYGDLESDKQNPPF